MRALMRPRLLGWSAYLLLPPLTALLLGGLAVAIGRPRTVSELLAWLGGSYLNFGLLSMLDGRLPIPPSHETSGQPAGDDPCPQAPAPVNPGRPSDLGQPGEYIVTWTVDVTAAGLVDAARQARSMRCDPDTTATVYEVQRTTGQTDGQADDQTAGRWQVDLLDPDRPTLQPLAADPDPDRAATASDDGRQLSDHTALEAIARILRDPQWAPGMLEDIAELVTRTGRSLDNPDEQPTWDRH